MRHCSRKTVVLIALASAVAMLAGCSTSTTTTTAVEPTEQTPATGQAPETATPVSGGVIASPADAMIDVKAAGLVEPPASYGPHSAGGQGAAFVIDPGGIAITRASVVAAATKVTTQLGLAEVVGFSECHDLAVLRVDAPDLAMTDLETLFATPVDSIQTELPQLTADTARDLVDRIVDGEKVDTMGLNLLDVPGRGLWVAGVAPGSAAADVGIEPEDFIVRFDDVDLWSTGERMPLCELIGASGADAAIEIFINRSVDGREWAATLNTGDTLERTGSQYPPLGYQSVQDPNASFFFYAPDEWEVEGGTSPFSDDDGQVRTASDIATMASSFEVGGITLARSDSWGADDLADVLDAMENTLGPQCHLAPSQEYDDGLYVGRINRFVGCGEVDTEVAFFAAVAPVDDHMVYGFFQLNDDNDREAMRVALDSLKPRY